MTEAPREWRPFVSRGTFTWARRLLVVAGICWYVANRHSGDLVLRFEAIALVLAGLWLDRIFRVSPRTGDAPAL